MGHSLSLCYSFWCRWALMKWELRPHSHQNCSLGAVNGWVTKGHSVKGQTAWHVTGRDMCRVVKGKLHEFLTFNLTFNLLKLHTFGKCSGGFVNEWNLSKRRNLLHYMTTDQMTMEFCWYRKSAGSNSCLDISFIFSSPAPKDDLPERGFWITTYEEWFNVGEVGLIWAGCLWENVSPSIGSDVEETRHSICPLISFRGWLLTRACAHKHKIFPPTCAPFVIKISIPLRKWSTAKNT